MKIDISVDDFELLDSLLENQTVHWIFKTIAERHFHIEPEEFAHRCEALMEEGIE